MAKSQEKTPLAKLRGILGKNVGSMAKLLGCSIATIRSVETGRLKISSKLKERIVHETWISPDWLTRGDVSVPAISTRREPYTLEVFKEAQAKKRFSEQVLPFFCLSGERDAIVRICSILRSANSQKRYHVATFKLMEALESLADEFGYHSDCPLNEGDSLDLLKTRALLQEHVANIDYMVNVGTEAQKNIKPTSGQPSPWPQKPAKSKRSARRGKV